ncbi:MAG: 23S rRNA (guanosine(2251)-2'-O)-methyltransferase RlmB [Acidobacteria bacterium]|nr:23S rRNA (guanosine(2251)-2'-O)-methyltransferase RlmB [Acidobacteriota bacterium]
MLIYGINPILEALRAGSVRQIRVVATARDRVRDIRDLARAQGVPVHVVPPAELDRAAHGGVHQGVVADIDDARDYDVRELVALAEGPPLLVVLDGIEDPHNLGAILRTVDAAGAHGVVRQTRHAARLDGAAAKASAGAVAHVRIANVVNIARAIDELKDAGVWTVGLDAGATASYAQMDFTQPTALVLGAEGQGLRRLVRDTCDHLASIPMQGHVGSLNVSAAAAVVLFEAVRQRRAAGPR